MTNRLTARLATRLPGCGVIVHTGRKTHRPYHTSINIFQRAGKYIVALTYGPEADWVRNVLASGRCTVETHGVRCASRTRVSSTTSGAVP